MSRKDVAPPFQKPSRSRASGRRRADRPIAPGKVTLTSRLPGKAPGPLDAAAQAMPAAFLRESQATGPSVSIRSAAEWTFDPWMDAAVRGQSLEREADSAADGAAASGSGSERQSRLHMASTAAQPSWRETGNLRGNPPVRDHDHPPNIDVIEDQAVYQERLEAARALYRNQVARANSLLDGNGNVTDHRYWFARVYSLVTRGEIGEALNQSFYYPSYVLQCVRVFEQIYADNFDAATSGSTVEDHWREAFRVCADNERLTGDDIAVAGLSVIGGAGVGAGVGAGAVPTVSVSCRCVIRR